MQQTFFDSITPYFHKNYHQILLPNMVINKIATHNLGVYQSCGKTPIPNTVINKIATHNSKMHSKPTLTV